jgi:hypothetical protein
LLPHGLKALFDQTRPDRRTVLGHVHGIPFSGKREDAFPSGHALHMGALASAAGTLPVKSRWVLRTLAVGISLTRVVVLAHWASDVVAGFALGAGLERVLRLWTGYPPASFKDDNHADAWRAAVETLEEHEMTEYVVRFLIGGVVVSAFAMLGDVLRPYADEAGQCRSALLLAHLGHGSMFDLSPLCEAKRTWTG